MATPYDDKVLAIGEDTVGEDGVALDKTLTVTK